LRLHYLRQSVLSIEQSFLFYAFAFTHQDYLKNIHHNDIKSNHQRYSPIYFTFNKSLSFIDETNLLQLTSFKPIQNINKELKNYEIKQLQILKIAKKLIETKHAKLKRQDFRQKAEVESKQEKNKKPLPPPSTRNKAKRASI